MTNEEIRIAVAKEMGWREDTEHTMGETIKVWRNAKYPFCSSLPNYPNSLDACAEFEATLNDEDWISYGRILEVAVDRDNGKIVAFAVGRATAHERCEAFLRLCGK